MRVPDSGATTPPDREPESLATLLGGRRGAIDASLPPVAFAAGWALAGRSIPLGVVAALVAAAAIAAWRLWRGARPRAALVGVLGVGVAALIVLHTGRAADFFLVQLLSNATSALAWTVSIIVRWPLLGVVVGTVLGQKARWRRDPALLRAYSLGSIIWVFQYLVRLAVFTPLWAAGSVVALGTMRALLSWPLVAACLAVSWWVIRRSLPAGHPGLRHPSPGTPPSAPPADHEH
ncbi:DUF3159 domain-containing protein [Actinobacteria bacterium YIM 96077]|uniref:DUF3159 domain-containing protein n=1 Tax=Phytoactinopolyspora halophila TaxID=1981511 RepID=A0A329QL73_9ACTN|nr:DUF3159 domain-containing protein [Phytoactinopolyspora halophila]AYY13496.1 DUF3159 domain-containing protein [Actinobacteria bacterium YIM 96077]RAW12449.1 DUF3159 domain-containing protein [Phytoactinopolyspora halophila]